MWLPETSSQLTSAILVTGVSLTNNTHLGKGVEYFLSRSWQLTFESDFADANGGPPVSSRMRRASDRLRWESPSAAGAAASIVRREGPGDLITLCTGEKVNCSKCVFGSDQTARGREGCRFTARRRWARASRRTPWPLRGGPGCGRSAPGG